MEMKSKSRAWVKKMALTEHRSRFPREDKESPSWQDKDATDPEPFYNIPHTQHE